MSNWLVKRNHQVRLLIQDEGDLDHLLDEKVVIKKIGLKYYLLYLPFICKRVVKKPFYKSIDVIYSFEGTTVWLSSILYKYMTTKPVFLSGVYQPNEYDSYTKFENKYYRRLIVSYLDERSLVFMNNANLISVEQNLNWKFKKTKILPIPVEVERFRDIKRDPIKFKIVSIGRLVDFKSYNLLMVDIVRQLIEEGIPVSYHIYGYGSLENQIRERISLLDLNKHVFLEGKLPYSKMSEVLTDAYVFIGMGTSIIEASLCKVPSILAIFCDENSETYGLFHEQRGYNLGEKVKGEKKYKIIDILRESFKWSKHEYETQSMEAFNYGLEFSIDNVMSKFLSFCSGEKLKQKPISNRFLYNYFIRIVLKKISRRLMKPYKYVFGK